jgi:hypothetical protein
VEVHYQCSSEDYVEAQKTHFKKTARILFAGYLLMIPVGLFEVRTIGFPRTAPALILASILLALPFLSISKRSVRRDFRKHPNLAYEYLLRADDNGLEMISNFSGQTSKWASYTAFRETSNLFMIYCGARMFTMVPKRAFTPLQLDEFRVLVRRKLPVK